MPTITGTLQAILDGDSEAGTLELALCGYGSQIPQLNGAALAARVTCDEVEVGGDGSFSFEVDGNDQIQPRGTYYTLTVKNDNGDIVQVNAYVFLSSQGTYNLNDTAPFDPSASPPPQLPPLLIGLLMVVPFAPTANFPGDQYTAWEIVLTGDCNPTFTNLTEGNLYTVIIVQDDAGHLFNWPANVKNPTTVDPDPDSITIQTFVAVSGELYPVGVGTYYP